MVEPPEATDGAANAAYRVRDMGFFPSQQLRPYKLKMFNEELTSAFEVRRRLRSITSCPFTLKTVESRHHQGYQRRVRKRANVRRHRRP